MGDEEHYGEVIQLAHSFGGGPRARVEAQQVLNQQRAPPAPIGRLPQAAEFGTTMFQFNNPVQSGLVGQPDLLTNPPPQAPSHATSVSYPHKGQCYDEGSQTIADSGEDVGNISFARLPDQPDGYQANQQAQAGFAPSNRLPSQYRPMVETAMYAPPVPAAQPQPQPIQQPQQQQPTSTSQQQLVNNSQHQQPQPLAGTSQQAVAATAGGGVRGSSASNRRVSSSVPASPRSRPRSAMSTPAASPPRNMTSMEAVVQRSAARAAGSRPMSAHQLNPNSLAAKISGAQNPPPGATIVQKEAQAFQQRYTGKGGTSARQQPSVVGRLYPSNGSKNPAQTPDAPRGPAAKRVQPPPRRASGPAAARPAWMPSEAQRRADEGGKLATQLNPQQQQQQPQQQEEGLKAAAGKEGGIGSRPGSPVSLGKRPHWWPADVNAVPPWEEPGEMHADGSPRASRQSSSPSSPKHAAGALPAYVLKHQQRESPERPASAGAVPRYMSPDMSKSSDLKQKQKAHEDEFFRKYRIRQHHDDQPDYRYSQPCAKGPQVILAQHLFSFDETHPGIASQHYKRSNKQEAELQQERQKLEVRRHKGQSKSKSATPSPRELLQDVSRLAYEREVGKRALRDLEQEGADLVASSHAIHRRALDAINAAQHKTKRLSRSPSPVSARAYLPGSYASPNRRSSWSGGHAAWSPSGSAYYDDLDVLSNPVGPLYSRTDRPLSAPYSQPPPLGHSTAGAPHAPEPPNYAPQHDLHGDANYPRGGPSRYAGGYQSDGPSGYASDYHSSALPSREASSFQHQEGPYGRSGYRDDGRDQGLPEGEGEGEERVMERDRAVQASKDPERAGRSLADHLARASGVRPQGESLGPALSEQEFQLATGVFDPQKYEEYNRQMDAEMEERALQAGYESDRERQDQAARAEAYDNLTQEERDILEAKAKEAAELEILMQQTWQEQNSWMDEYRTRLGPYEGYGPSASQDGQQQCIGENAQAYDEEDLPPYLPHLSEELEREYGPGGTARSKSPLRPKGAQPFHSTVPVPFTFEERAANRPKTIMQVKGEQDRHVKRMEQEAAKRYRFKANPIPRKVTEPKYERMLMEAEATRQINREGRVSELGRMLEAPFSFQAADEQRAAIKEAVAALAKNPNRFLIPFKHRPVPKAVHGEKFKFMQIDLEGKRSQARARAEAARAMARERVEMDMQQRQNTAVKAYQERLRTVDPIWNQKYDTKPLGAVPDFDLLHMQWEQRMATLRALNRRRATVPEEFHCNGGDPEERKAQKQKALERRQRIILDMALDEELLPEQRWPHKSARGRVRPTPPPAFEKPDFKVTDTRSNMLRIAATRKAKDKGQFDSRCLREARDNKKMKEDAKIRAQAWVKLKSGMAATTPEQGLLEQQGANPGDSAAGVAGVDADVAASHDQQQNNVAGANRMHRGPAMHIEARHAQIEAQVRGMVEDALLSRGVDAYNAYNEFKYDEGA